MVLVQVLGSLYFSRYLVVLGGTPMSRYLALNVWMFPEVLRSGAGSNQGVGIVYLVYFEYKLQRTNCMSNDSTRAGLCTSL